jgi:hypothetical protein
MSKEREMVELAERDQRRRDAITAWWERQALRDFIRRVRATASMKEGE